MNNYESMTHEELTEHKARLEEALKGKEVEELAARVAALGYKLVKEKANGHEPAKAKYRLPDGKDWSGKGKMPLVLKAALQNAEGFDGDKGTFDTKENREKALAQYAI